MGFDHSSDGVNNGKRDKISLTDCHKYTHINKIGRHCMYRKSNVH